jgi:hypothetical protein
MNVEALLRSKQSRIEQSHRVIPATTALLVIDMQHGFLDAGAALEVPKGREVVPNVARLIERCRASNVLASQLAFSSSREGGLGDALPAGTVRFYQRDRAGNPQFIGENAIGPTPMGSELTLSTGDACDIYVQAEVESRQTITGAEWERSARYRVFEEGQVVRQVEVERPRTFYRTTMRYTLTNAQSRPVEVELVQAGLDRGWWGSDFRITSEDVPGVQLNADRRKYVIEVPANGRREVRVTYETRY